MLTRHAARVKATKDRIELKLKIGLRTEKLAIEAELVPAPANRGLLKEKREVDEDIAKVEIELADEVGMKLTEDKKISHSNAWRTHRENNESPNKSRGIFTPCCSAISPKYESTR